MYTLFVTHLALEKADGGFVIERSRFLEYTADPIATQLSSLSTEAKESIRSWPCLLMPEGKGSEQARLVEIGQVTVAGINLRINVRPLPEARVFLNDDIWKMRGALDIADFEFSRNHWAVKDQDLFAILAAAGHTFVPAVAARFTLQQLPAPTRTQLIQARDTISSWGHTEIDDLLLEAGIPGVSAGRELGSRRDRANAIIRYALEHPSETTAEESLFSAFLVKRAASSGGSTGEGPAHADVPIPAGDPLAAAAPALTKTTRATNAVFVVHGRNEAVRAQVVEFLASLGLRPIVLHEQPNMGRHLLTKFIQEAELITFAVVLMTDDDVGAQRDAPIAPRARQNVILELGYFLSHLGQARVCALVSPGLETPSDFDGIVYIRIDPEGRWRTDLERELRAADMPLRVA